MHLLTKKACVFIKIAFKNCLFFLFLVFFCAICACNKQQLPSIGEQIRRERLKQNISQIQLATAISMNVSSLSLIEDGLATPIKEKIEAIESHLNVHFIWDSTAIDLTLRQ